MRKSKCLLAAIMLFVMLLVSCSNAFAKSGIDRSRIREAAGIYPVTLTFGGMSFEGTLSRMDKLTDSEVEQIIKQALKDRGMTEEDVAEAQDTVDKVTKLEEMTPEDIERVLKNVLKLAGFDNAYDLIKALGGEDSGALIDTMQGYGTDQAKEKALGWILEQAVEGAGEAASSVTKLADTILISYDQYQRDQQKWKDRVDLINATRKLREFYERVRELQDNQSSVRSRGWVLNIADSASRNFTFFSIEGNLQTWNVDLNLKKPDRGELVGTFGTYSGVVSITVEYEMSPFDRGFEDWVINKSGLLDGQKAYFEKISSAVSDYTIDYFPDEYDPTRMHRILDGSGYSTTLYFIPVSQGDAKMKLDFSSFTDDKFVEIKHKLDFTMSTSGKIKWKTNNTAIYTADNGETLNWQFNYSSTMTYGGRTTSGKVSSEQYSRELDPSAWEPWTGEAWLEIKYK